MAKIEGQEASPPNCDAIKALVTTVTPQDEEKEKDSEEQIRNEKSDNTDNKTTKDQNDDSNDKNCKKSERKVQNLRKNIKDVIDESQLDATTLAAQRQESERLARVQEQQRLIREAQRQLAAENRRIRRNSKSFLCYKAEAQRMIQTPNPQSILTIPSSRNLVSVHL